jgi:small-conductance mechanosensitive channel
VEKLLLSVHVLAAIVFIGGSAVATSLFPRYAPVAAGVPAGTAAQGMTESPPDERHRAVAVAMHRITGGYSLFGIVVPVAGIVLAFVQGRTGEIWITLSMILTAAAGALLALQIYPRQRAALAEPGERDRLRTLSMLAGVYNLLWAIVVVLMIVRPGYTEGA